MGRGRENVLAADVSESAAVAVQCCRCFTAHDQLLQLTYAYLAAALELVDLPQRVDSEWSRLHRPPSRQTCLARVHLLRR